MKLLEITDYNLKSQTILNESWSTLTESQRMYVGRWEKELWPLIESYVKLSEATLTAAQIKQVFQSAEDVAMAGGDNKNLLGKVGGAAAAAAKLPVDMAKKIDAKINELGRAAKQAGPVKDMDAKFKQLKADITAKNGDSKIVQGIQKVSDWAKENPGKASLAVGILTTIAAFAGGPVGGAAAGFILRATKDLLQGEDLSSAIGKSVKTAAYGAIAGWAMRGIGDWLEGLRADAVPYEKVPGLTQIDVGLEKTLTAPGFSNVKTLGSMIVPADQAEQFSSLVQAAKGGDIDSFNELWDFAKSFDVREYNELASATNDMLQAVAQQNDAFLQNLTLANDAVAAIAQGTASGKMDADEVKVDGKPVEDEGENPNVVKSNTESLSMEEKYELYLQEGPMDALKKVGGAIATGAKAVGGAAKAVGKELGNKVTANKLMTMWQKMGEPTDSGSIMNILKDAGLNNDQIGQIGQAAKVDLGAAPTDAGTDTAAGAPGADASKAAPGTAGASAGQQSAAGADASKAAPGTAGASAGTAGASAGTAGASAGTAGASGNLQSLADEIKKAGPEVIDAVKALLSTGGATRTGGKVAGKLSTNPRAVSRRQATAAKRATDAGLSVSKAGATPAAQPAAAPAPKAKAPAKAAAKAAKPKYKPAPKATTAPAV